MILCDNIIFELQPIGGVSRYWAQTIRRLDEKSDEFAFLEGPKTMGNAFRRELTLRNPVLAETMPIGLRRFVGTNLKSKVFHSSYYRVSRHAQANVVTIHDFMNELFPSGLNDYVLAQIKKRACKHADAIAVVSNQTKNDLLRLYPFVDPARVHVTYNGVDDDFYAEALSSSFKIGSSELIPRGYFLYVGTRGYCKNFPYVLHFLAEAHRQGLELPLVLVGGESLSAAEYATAAALGLPPTSFVQKIGLSNSDLRRLYSNCLALLIPSIYEGFGLPAAEAARCGALVLGARGSALDEIIGESDYAFDLTKEGEAARLLSLGLHNAQSEKERARLCDHSKKFDWGRSGNKLMEIYGDL